MRMLFLAVLLAWSVQAPASEFGLVQDALIIWRDPDERFGGLSGIEVTDRGTRVLAIGDRGIWVTGALERAQGRLTGVRTTRLGPLLNVAGKRLKEGESDAEGLRLDARGRAYVSFEGFQRIRRYDRIDGKATRVPGYAAFGALGGNTGLEAIAVDADGVIYALPERTQGGPGRRVPVYRFRDGAWDQALAIPRSDGFDEVDADFGPDGHLYVLERKFEWLGGFATRLRRFRLGPNGFEAETTLLKTPFGELDNMEGLSVWRDDAGRVRLTLISDDNFFPLQRTMIAEYILNGV